MLNYHQKTLWQLGSATIYTHLQRINSDALLVQFDLIFVYTISCRKSLSGLTLKPFSLLLNKRTALEQNSSLEYG